MKFINEKINKEFEIAEKAISAGNEGKARVCARRAVSFAIQEKLTLLDKSVQTPELKKLINIFLKEVACSAEIKIILDHMTWKVDKEKDSDKTFWPYPDVDLIKEAKWFVKELLST